MGVFDRSKSQFEMKRKQSMNFLTNVRTKMEEIKGSVLE